MTYLDFCICTKHFLINFSHNFFVFYFHLGPSGSELPFNCLQRGKFCCIEYTPHEVGIHTIEVLISERHISGSPFYCNVFDPNSVRIIDMDQSGKIKREITFTG